jgi:hypothetical protein
MLMKPVARAPFNAMGSPPPGVNSSLSPPPIAML